MTDARMYRIALVQYPIQGNHTLPEVMRKIEEYVVQARASGAGLVVLPELAILDTSPIEASVSDFEVADGIARRLAGDYVTEVLRICRRHDTAVLAGSLPESTGSGLANTAILGFPDGRVVRQTKIFLTPWDKSARIQPGSSLRVFEAPWGRTVILVCYDAEFPVLSEALTRAQPEVILIPSMTESEHGFFRVRWTAQARAIEHHAYVGIAGTVGRPSPSWEHHGQGVLLGPQEGAFAGVLASGPVNQPGMVIGELNLEALRMSRKRSGFYPALDESERVGPIAVER